ARELGGHDRHDVRGVLGISKHVNDVLAGVDDVLQSSCIHVSHVVLSPRWPCRSTVRTCTRDSTATMFRPEAAAAPSSAENRSVPCDGRSPQVPTAPASRESASPWPRARACETPK